MINKIKFKAIVNKEHSINNSFNTSIKLVKYKYSEFNTVKYNNAKLKTYFLLENKGKKYLASSKPIMVVI